MSEDIDIGILFKNIYAKRKLISYTTLIIFVLGFIYAFFIVTPMFKSTTTLYPVTSEENSSNKLQLFAAQFGFMGLSTTNNYNIPDVVKSRRIRELILSKNWVTKNGKKITLYKLWGLNSNNKELNKEKAVKKLGKLITVFNNDETGLITISVLTRDPKLSADIVNYIAQEVSRYIQEQRKKEKMKYRNFIEKRVKDAQKQLIKSENKLKEFIVNNRIISGNPKLQFTYDRLKREIEIKKELYVSLEKQSELAKIEEKKKEPIIRILDVGEVPVNKFKPKRLYILITALIVGFILGMIISFINLNKLKFLLKTK